MTSLMQRALGADWQRLPPVLQAHYREGSTVETGHLDIEYPARIQPVLRVLGWFGALVHRRGREVETRVERQAVGERLLWRRTMRFADGETLRFDSAWELGAPGRLIEFVNPVLGLEMAPCVVGQSLHYRGVRFVARIGSRLWTIPQWLALGTTRIVEDALDDQRYAMDFRMTHPWFGELFRYSGVFRTDAAAISSSPAAASRSP